MAVFDIPTESMFPIAEIAEEYIHLPMQEKINTIAQVFGHKTGRIETRPCTGKWRGASDVSIVFGGGDSLFLGTDATRVVRMKKIQNEFLNRAVTVYNPRIVELMIRQGEADLVLLEKADAQTARDKEVDAYTFLHAELCTTGDYLGWYYITLSVGGVIHAHLTADLNWAIKSGSVKDLLAQADHYWGSAGGVREVDVDYVFAGTGFSTASDLYTAQMSPQAFQRAQEMHNRSAMIAMADMAV